MAKVRPSDVLFWLLALLALASVVLFMLVLSGAVAIDSATTASQTAGTTKTTAAAPTSPTAKKAKPKAAAAPKATPKTATQETATQPTPTPAQKPAQATTVVLTATRGDCWFQARAGSAQGKVLDERVLSQGESISLKSKTVWLTVGASGNLDVTVNGKPQALAAGTVSVVLSANGSAN